MRSSSSSTNGVSETRGWQCDLDTQYPLLTESRAQQRVLEDLTAESRRLVLDAQQDAEAMAARAALLREEKEEEARRASEAFAEMRRRADVVSTANSLACRRAGQQPGMLTAESIAARLRAQLRLLEEEENAERGESETATDAVGVAEMARGQGCSGAARAHCGARFWKSLCR